MPVNPETILDFSAERANSAGRKLIDSLRGTKPLAVGTEKAVYPYKNGNVVIFQPLGEKRFKRQFYTYKLLHLVLPNNIPDAHTATLYLMVRDEIKQGKPMQYEDRRDAEDALTIRLNELGVRGAEMSPGNFIHDENGNTQYVDTLYFDTFRPEGLVEAIRGLQEQDSLKAQRYAEKAGLRLNELPNHP
jgi:hypothetical protein